MESYRTVGTCCRQIIFDVKDNILVSCKFINGCSGNAQALARLTIGQPLDFIIEKLQGISCRQSTSCPDQLARALKEYQEKEKEKEKNGETK